MKILITGGAGFVGSHVAEYYAKKDDEVVVFDNLSRAELLALKNIYPKTNDGVVSQFGLQFINGGLIEEFYAKSLTKAQTKHEKADCDIYYEPSKEEAETIIEDAEKFLERIKRAIEEI